MIASQLQKMLLLTTMIIFPLTCLNYPDPIITVVAVALHTLCSVTSPIRSSLTFTHTPGPAIKLPSVSEYLDKAKHMLVQGVNITIEERLNLQQLTF